MSTYTDLNLEYTKDRRDLSPVVKDIENIKQSLLRLFNTPKGSVPFNREYGTSLRSLLFENSIESSDIAMFLYMDITEFEPRVELSPYNIEIYQKDKNTYVVNCKFTIPEYNSETQTVETEITDK